MSERPNVIFALLLASAAAVAALVAAGLVGLGLGGIAALSVTLLGTFSACAFFLAELRSVPLSPLALAAFAGGSALSLGRVLAAYLRARALLQRLPLQPLGGELHGIARAAGAGELYVVPAHRPAAFCFGLRRPRVVLTSGLVSRLTPEERAAVVWHEAQHARTHEPLKCLLARLAAGTFFWAPALRDLLDRYLLARELAADRLAACRTSRSALAGALCQVIAQPPIPGAVGLADRVPARVDRLLDPRAELPPLFRPARLLISVLSVTVLVLLLVFPARLGMTRTASLHAMLTSLSLHGLPGMAAGLAANVAVLALAIQAARRLRLKRARRPEAR